MGNIHTISGGTKKPRPSEMKFHRANAGALGACVFCGHVMGRVIAFAKRSGIPVNGADIVTGEARIVFVCDPCFEAVRQIIAIPTWE